jgi:hypothetical protein
MIWDAVGLYAELGRRRTYLGGRGGGSGSHDGSQRKGQRRPLLACRCRCYGSGRRKTRERARFSPRRQASSEGDGVHEATQREIDAGGWSLKTTTALRPRLGRRRCKRVDGVLERERVWKRYTQGLDLGSYRLVRRRERWPGEGKWPSMAMKPAALMTIKGRF